MLGVDPIAVRIGTIMPGLLPLIKVGTESELGRAVSQLTGLSALADLADHVRRVKTKIDREYTKARSEERERADTSYQTAKHDLEKLLQSHPTLAPARAIPAPSSDKTVEAGLDEITKHFESAKTAAFDSARGILGVGFDPAKPALLADLEKNIARALERVSQPKSLPSVVRLAGLRALKQEEIEAVDACGKEIIAEAETLTRLAEDPSKAARVRLYARIISWIEEHPDPERREDICVVCGGALQDAVDPITGEAIKAHMHDARANATLVGLARI